MKLYYDPVSTSSRPLMMFAVEHGLNLQWELVSLYQEEQKAPAYLAINPNGCVPALVDDDLVLTECSAILEHLGEVAGSATLPTDPIDRSKVRATMSWFMTNCHSAIGPGFVYPIIYRAFYPYSAGTYAELVEIGRCSAARWLAVLDGAMIGPDRTYVAGEALTIADYLGASVITLLEAVDFDFSPYPNIRRWLAAMKSRPSWAPTYAAFEGMRSALRPAA